MGPPDCMATFCIEILQTTQNQLDFQPIQYWVNIIKRVDYKQIRMILHKPVRVLILMRKDAYNHSINLKFQTYWKHFTWHFIRSFVNIFQLNKEATIGKQIHMPNI